MGYRSVAVYGPFRVRVRRRAFLVCPVARGLERILSFWCHWLGGMIFDVDCRGEGRVVPCKGAEVVRDCWQIGVAS